MIVETKSTIIPPETSWCGAFDFTMAELSVILKAFDESPLGNEELTLTYFKGEDERIHIHANNAGAPPLVTGFILGWEAQEENYQKGSRGI